MTAPHIRVETGRGYALGVCSTCPSWRPMGHDRAEVLRAAATHADLCHGDPAAAATLRHRAGISDTPGR